MVLAEKIDQTGRFRLPAVERRMVLPVTSASCLGLTDGRPRDNGTDALCVNAISRAPT